MGNILFGLLYFLAIPCTSMILVFYAVANLNVVSWGTRDSTTPTTRGGEKKSLSERLGLGRIRRVISGKGEPEVEKKVTSDYTFSFGNLFRYAVHPGSSLKAKLQVLTQIIPEIQMSCCRCCIKFLNKIFLRLNIS